MYVYINVLANKLRLNIIIIIIIQIKYSNTYTQLVYILTKQFKCIHQLYNYIYIFFLRAHS